MIRKEQYEYNKEIYKKKNFEELLKFEDAYGHVVMKTTSLLENIIEFWHFMYNNE